MLKAVLWDVDGTLAETERDGHRVAFNVAFQALGLPWHWDVKRYGELLRVTGGRERLLHDMATRSDAPVAPHERLELAARVHARKNALYAGLVRAGTITLRPGVRKLLAGCQAMGLRLGIATATSRANVQALLETQLGPQSLGLFDAVVCSEDVVAKKPHPQVYEEVLERLRLEPLEVLAIEDSPGGAAAARAAHIPVVVTRSEYFLDETVEDVVAVGPGFHRREGWRPALTGAGPHDGSVTAQDLVAWHARMELVSQFG